MFDGFLDAATCNVIAGWAWNATTPNTPIDVDFFIDNDSFASIRAPANQFRQDLANAGKGNGAHGFSFVTSAFLKDGQPHAIAPPKFRGTTLELNNSPRTINCGPVSPNYQGFHDGQDCNVIVGWAWDSNMPNAQIVDIYSDTVLIATVPEISSGRTCLMRVSETAITVSRFPPRQASKTTRLTRSVLDSTLPIFP